MGKEEPSTNTGPSRFSELSISYEHFHDISINFIKNKILTKIISKVIIKYSLHWEYVLVNKIFENSPYHCFLAKHVVFSKEKFRRVSRQKNSRKILTKMSWAPDKEEMGLFQTMWKGKRVEISFKMGLCAQKLFSFFSPNYTDWSFRRY